MPSGSLDVVIVGGGRVGAGAARRLHDRGHSVRLVEADADRCAAISDQYVATVINGDATRPDVLAQADLPGADVLAGLTGITGVNLAVCMLGARLVDGDGPRTVLRTDREDHAAYADIVDDVVYPEGMGAVGAVNAIVGGDRRALERLAGRLDVMDLTVTEGAPVAGKELAAVSLPRGSIVVAEASGGVAGPDTEIRAGETYIVVAEPGVSDEVDQLFRG